MSFLSDLEEWHASHECNSGGKCQCQCGCEDTHGCAVMFGPYCSLCLQYIARGKGDCAHAEGFDLGPSDDD